MPEIFGALAAVMGEIAPIAKSRRAQVGSDGRSYLYRGIDDVYNALNKIMAKHGVVALPTLVKYEREDRKTSKGTMVITTLQTIQYTFFARDGSSTTAIVLGEASDSGDKGVNKSSSAAHKVCLLQAFCIPTGDQKDTESQTYELSSARLKDLEKENDGLKKRLIKATQVWNEQTEELKQLKGSSDSKDSKEK